MRDAGAMIANMSASVRAHLSLPTLVELGKVFRLRRTTWNYVDDAYRGEERKMARSSRTAQPPKHGQIKVATMKIEHARKHLAQMTQGAEEVRDYGGHDATGVSSQGALTPGGASGADYETRNVGDTPDADSMGPTGY
jgi:hypothetical protein